MGHRMALEEFTLTKLPVSEQLQIMKHMDSRGIATSQDNPVFMDWLRDNYTVFIRDRYYRVVSTPVESYFDTRADDECDGVFHGVAYYHENDSNLIREIMKDTNAK